MLNLFLWAAVKHEKETVNFSMHTFLEVQYNSERTSNLLKAPFLFLKYRDKLCAESVHIARKGTRQVIPQMAL